ncbi:MAG TPA: hypothetical protein VN903_08640 [Polyangia bacterium]|jgi:hypothetical protein|nr:hypothetical protein [Polyangia bacterium]
MPAARPTSVGPSDADRYGWPGTPEDALGLEATRIARHVVRSAASVVALLPVASRPPLDDRVAPVLLRVAEALLGFVTGNVAVIDTWRTWPWGESVEWGDRPAHRSRWLEPRILEISPVPCGDAQAAAVALENALAARPEGLAVTLVNLGGYAEPGAAPAGLRLVDAAALLVSTRRSRRRAVATAAAHIPDGKLVGAILIG